MNKESEHRNLVSKVLYYLYHSYYTYEEIGAQLFITDNKVKKIISDTDYIAKEFGENEVIRLKQQLQKRTSILGKCRLGADRVIVKKPEYRNIVKEDIITVTTHQYALIEQVACFFEYDGNSEKVALSTHYSLNSLVTSLQEKDVKELLSTKAYEKLQLLLNIDQILTQNRLYERKQLIETVVRVVDRNCGYINLVTEELEYPLAVIKRILENPVTKIVCKQLNIHSESLQLKEKNDIEFEDINALVIKIANYMIEKGTSYRETAKVFGIGKTTVEEYMNIQLPKISPLKYEKLRKIVEDRTSTSKISEETKERVMLEYDLLKRGYTINQIAFLVNNTYSTAQRDLTNKLSIIDEEKYQEAQKVLTKNKRKLIEKH